MQAKVKRYKESEFSKLRHDNFQSDKYQHKKDRKIKLSGNENLGVSRKQITTKNRIKKKFVLQKSDSTSLRTEKANNSPNKKYTFKKNSLVNQKGVTVKGKVAFHQKSPLGKSVPHYKVSRNKNTLKKSINRIFASGFEKSGSIEKSDSSDLSESTTTNLSNTTNKFVSKKTYNKFDLRIEAHNKYQIRKQPQTKLQFESERTIPTKLRNNQAVIKKVNPQKKGIKKLQANRFRDYLTKENATKTIKSIPKQAGKHLNKLLTSIISAIKTMASPLNSLIAGGIVVIFLIIGSIVGLFGMVFISTLGSQSYSMSSYEATMVNQMFSEREMDYLEMLVYEAELVGDEGEISYQSVGHEPHEVIALVQVMATEQMADSETSKLTRKMAEEIVEEIFDARYSFSKYTTTVTTETEDGLTENEVTKLTSITTPFDNLIYGGYGLGMNVDTKEFIEKIGPLASKIADENNLYASVMIAQAILESGGNQLSALASPPYFNIFGIKGSYNGNTVNFNTKEDDGSGEMYVINDGFRDYNSYEEAMSDYAQVLNHVRYRNTKKSSANSYRDATMALTGTYATDTQYNVKLNSLIQSYDLTVFDTFSEDMSNQLTEAINFSSAEDAESKDLDDKPVYPLENMPSTSSGYDYRTHPITGVRHFHNGIDLPVPTGTPVLTVKNGEVAEMGFNKSAGNYIFVRMNDGYYAAYFHLSEILVQHGEVVDQGDIIGTVGSTGSSTGPHLHFEIVDRVWGVSAGGTAYNPTDYLQGAISVSPNASGNGRLNLSEEQRKTYKEFVNNRGMLGGYASPIENYDWGNHVIEPWGMVWNETTNSQYFSDKLSLFVPTDRDVLSQIGGTVEEVGESENGHYITIKSKDTITIQYGNLENVNLSVGEAVYRGSVIGQTTDSPLTIKMKETKTNNALNPQIMMFTEHPKANSYEVP